MVNYNLNIIASLAGSTYILLSLICFYFSIRQLIRESAKDSSIYMLAAILQLALIAPGLLISGILVLSQGWRLDPVMQVQQLITLPIVIYGIIFPQLLYNKR